MSVPLLFISIKWITYISHIPMDRIAAERISLTMKRVMVPNMVGQSSHLGAEGHKGNTQKMLEGLVEIEEACNHHHTHDHIIVGEVIPDLVDAPSITIKRLVLKCGEVYPGR